MPKQELIEKECGTCSKKQRVRLEINTCYYPGCGGELGVAGATPVNKKRPKKRDFRKRGQRIGSSATVRT